MQSLTSLLEDKEVETKVLISLLVSNFPPEYTRDDLIGLFENE